MKITVDVRDRVVVVGDSITWTGEGISLPKEWGFHLDKKRWYVGGVEVIPPTLAMRGNARRRELMDSIRRRTKCLPLIS